MNLVITLREVERHEDDSILFRDIDEEIKPDSDDEYSSDEETASHSQMPYDVDKMFEIIDKRDNHKWSVPKLQHDYTKLLANPDSMRKQLSRFDSNCKFWCIIC